MNTKKGKGHLCRHCASGFVEDNNINVSRATCAACGVILRSNKFEIRVEGQNADEVQTVSSHLLGQYELHKSRSFKFKNTIMGWFRKKVKCKRFYEIESRTIDIAGLRAGVAQKFDFGLGSMKIDTKHYQVSDSLQNLDLLQFGICNDINGISDPVQRDDLLKKVIETKTRMLELVFDLNSQSGTSKLADNQSN